MENSNYNNMSNAELKIYLETLTNEYDLKKKSNN